MHEFGSAKYCVNRTGLNAKRATYANFFVYNDDGFFLFFNTMFWIKWLWIAT